MIAEIIAAIVGATVAVGGAALCGGPMALAWAAVLAAVTKAGIAVAALAGGWRPTWRLRLDDIQPWIGFGTALTASNAVNQVNANADLLVGGRLLGMDELGMYGPPRSLSLALQSVVAPVVNRVGLPAIASSGQEPDGTRRAYLAMVSATAATGAPIYALGALHASDVCAVLLGPTWSGQGNAMAALCGFGFLAP